MKYLTITTIIVLNILSVHAQNEKALQMFDKQPNRRLQQIEGTRYKLIDDLHRTAREKDLGEFVQPVMIKTQTKIDSTVFVVSELDTLEHAGKFVFWQDVDADCGYPRAPFVGDINKNGRAEIYGGVITFNHENSWDGEEPMACYELQTDGKFVKKFQFPKPKRETFARAIIDLDNDGINELHVRSCDSIKPPWDTIVQYSLISKDRFMKQPDDTSLALQDFFKWPKDTSFTNGWSTPVWGDFDHDGNKDCVFISYSHRYAMVFLEYNPVTKYLDSVYAFDPLTYTQGFLIGDFDNDGKTDIVTGSIDGKVFVLENTGNNTYQNVWTGEVETNNAYLNFWTNDIDGNGKKEFWVGGDGFFSGSAKTRLTCFESNSDNSYVPVARIDFVGIFSFFAGNVFALDVDGDGKEEIGICMDSGFYLLQFTGSPGHHSYKLIYVKTSEFADYPDYPGRIFGAILYDVDSDGKYELLISHDLVKPSIGRIHDFVRLYKQNLPLSVPQKSVVVLPSEYVLFQNYPNPFNASTTIQYRLPKQSYVTVTIYSILGKEIKTIVNQQQKAGEYRVLWNGTDEHGLDVNSGVYFVQLRANSFTETKKLLYLK